MYAIDNHCYLHIVLRQPVNHKEFTNMSDDKSDPKAVAAAVVKLEQILRPLVPEDRQRAVTAAMTLFGDVPVSAKRTNQEEPPQSEGGISGKAVAWMKKNGITREQLEHVFSIDNDAIDVIASKMPGKSKRQQTVQAYVICGLRSFLLNGELGFTDKDTRDLCNKVGCYDSANHSNYIRALGNLVSGTKDAGWKLTNPGLNECAKIVRELTSAATAA
jgi:hypothetical protein